MSRSESPRYSGDAGHHVLTLPLSEVDQAAVEDVYELSPTQQGMLYHSLGDSGRGMYCVQVAYRLHGPLDVRALAAAWQHVVDRHPVLRTSFRWSSATAAEQVVHPRAAIDVIYEDWRSLDAHTQQVRLQHVLEAEGRTGFDLQQPPLLRVKVFRCADEEHEMVLAHHHLLTDGSCKPLLFSELFESYEAFRIGRDPGLGPAAPYRRFIEWLRRQDVDAAERYWRAALAGVVAPTPLWPRSPSHQGSAFDGRAFDERAFDEQHAELDISGSDQLRAFARTHRLTLGTIVTGVWALILAHASRCSDVVFGVTVNGQPPALEGVESMIGLFINTIPVRVRIPERTPTTSWLRELQLQQAVARDHDFAGLTRIQRWSEVSGGQPLFDSIVVFENNAGYGAESESFGDVAVTRVQPLIRNSLPVTLRSVPGRALSVQVLHDTGRYSAEAMRPVAADVVALLRDLPAQAGNPVMNLMQRLDELQQQRVTAEAHAYQQRIRHKLRDARRPQQSVQEDRT